MLRITVLMDDKPSAHKGLVSEHGLSFFAEYNGRRLLFDCGSSGNFLQNARTLGLDLRDLDCVILSHSHYDHAAGFRALTEHGLGSRILYTGPGFFEPKYTKKEAGYSDASAGFDADYVWKHGISHRQITGAEEIFPGVYLIAAFPRIHDFETIPSRFVRRTENGFLRDDFSDEICAAFETEEGLAVLVGCAHPGILNILSHVERTLQKPVKAVFGGTHLIEADAERIAATVVKLREMNINILGLNHCSGEKAECAISADPGIPGCYLGTGDCVTLD